MKKLIFLAILLTFGLNAFTRQAKDRMMPVTTSSREAMSLYSQGIKYFDKVFVDKALETFKKALEQDPDFFMVNYQMAFYYLLNRDRDSFEDYAEAAINCKQKLSDAEGVLKDVLLRIKQGRTDVTDAGRKLVEMYPNDPNSYNNLVYFQTLAGDSTGMVETLNKAIGVVQDPAPFYNQLGYAYLTLKQNDKAEEAFDKYIELDPKNPNVYDSKGDYYMYQKDFEKAYESYMKAYTMDPAFSHDKAETAKQLYERTEGKKLQIISL